MNENTIVQFVGFITTLDFDRFVVRWDYYVQELKDKKMKATLQKQYGTKNRYRYISQHSGLQEDFRFAFMKKRASEHFPDHNARVIHMGGYKPLLLQSNLQDKKRYVNVMLYIKNQDADIEHYRQIPLYQKCNVYQAYFENCTYAYIMEFFVKDADVTEFMLQLKTLASNPTMSDEAGLYEEFSLLHA
jgi:hypothetical protein